MNPTNEQGVVVLFSMLVGNSKWSIKSIGTAFPDVTLVYNDEIWLAEFEFKTSNFNLHKHDVRGCDLVICWQHDERDFPLPVIELSKPFWLNKNYKKTDSQIKELYYWKMTAKALAREVNRLKQTQSEPLTNSTDIVGFPIGFNRDLTKQEKETLRSVSTLPEYQFQGRPSLNKLTKLVYGSKNSDTLNKIKEVLNV